MIHKIPDRLGSYKMADGAIGEILVLEKGKEREEGKGKGISRERKGQL